MGRYMQDVINSVGESSIFEDVQVSKGFTHFLIRDWSFYDERYIAGDGVLRHIDTHVIRAMPELESISTWVYVFMSPFIRHPFDPEQIQNLHLIPDSKLPKATHNKESIEKFTYTIKHPNEAPSAPPTLVLEAHPFILYKFKTIKLYFITENDILIDFFFWHIPLAPPRTEALASASS